MSATDNVGGPRTLAPQQLSAPQPETRRTAIPGGAPAPAGATDTVARYHNEYDRGEHLVSGEAHGEPAFFEIGVPDAKRAKTFYGQLLGWTFHSMEGEQAWIETPSIRGGVHDNDPESRIDLFFAVPDIDAAVATVRKLGGQADDPGEEEPGFGRFVFCRDDQGVRFGLRQPPAG